MCIILGILKFLVIAVYGLFFLDSILVAKSALFDKEDKDSFSWFDVIYLAYALFNFVFIIKVLRW